MANNIGKIVKGPVREKGHKVRVNNTPRNDRNAIARNEFLDDVILRKRVVGKLELGLETPGITDNFETFPELVMEGYNIGLDRLGRTVETFGRTYQRMKEIVSTNSEPYLGPAIALLTKYNFK